MNEDKHKILDLKMPIEDQKKLIPKLKEKKFQVDIEIDGKVRFMYGDDPIVLELYAKSIGAKILKVIDLKESGN